MITVGIIIYIITVFVSRWINYLLYKKDDCSPIAWFIWLIPIYNIVLFGFILLMESDFEKNWFTGKNWEQKN